MTDYAQIDIELERLLALEPAARRLQIDLLRRHHPERAQAVLWLLALAAEPAGQSEASASGSAPPASDSVKT